MEDVGVTGGCAQDVVIGADMIVCCVEAGGGRFVEEAVSDKLVSLPGNARGSFGGLLLAMS